jgi:hypothetical protein
MIQIRIQFGIAKSTPYNMHFLNSKITLFDFVAPNQMLKYTLNDLISRWCSLLNWRRLTNIVCLVIDGVGINEITQNKSKFPWISSNLGDDLLEIVSPASYGVSVSEELALVPTSKR